MNSEAGGATATQAPPAPQASAEVAASAPFAAPNQYHLSGGGISISYFPNGRGPIGPAGAIHLIYQDGMQTLSFTKDEIRVVNVPDLGTILSVTLHIIPDVGSTTFSLLLPQVRLADHLGASASVHTDAITTLHKSTLFPLPGTQVESYTVTALTGTATIGILEA
jgi:hypothetical protein